ncbi:MAG: type II toxin-antitoxin system HicB family antitoxin [Planctomycetota bacterium]
MITRYIEKALGRARYEALEDGSYCATVRGLKGVVALGRTVEECRRELADVIEAWILVRVAQGLSVPPLGGVTIKIKRAS